MHGKGWRSFVDDNNLGKGQQQASCPVCGGFCQGGKPDDLRIHVWDEFHSSAIVPCNARVFVNNTTGDFMRFECGGRKYSVDIIKESNRTKISGSGWEKFTSDKRMGGGSLVTFDMSLRPWKAHLAMFSEGIFEDPAADEMNVEEDGEDEEVDDTPVVVEYTTGVCLSTQEKDKLDTVTMEFNNELLEKLVPTNTAIVHRLTATNIAAGNMKVPHRIAGSLAIPKQGMLGVSLNSGNAKTIVSYNKCSDVVLCKNDWSKFVGRASLETDKHIMFYFKTTTQPHINMKMVVCKI